MIGSITTNPPPSPPQKPHTHPKYQQAPPSILGPAYLRLLALEEKRLDLQPEKRGELLPLYEALLAAVSFFLFLLFLV